VQYGGFFKDKDFGRRTAVIGRGAAEKLFGEGVPLGRAFDFRDDTFVVGGVLETI
jgi:ABC-type antimicrobial peptide transport system permease subunit